MIAASAYVGRTSVIGAAYRPLLSGAMDEAGEVTVGENAWIGEFCVVGGGVVIGNSTILDHYSHVEQGARIGDRVLLIYRAHVCAEVIVGTDSVIGGFIGERTTVGKDCRIFGSVVHQHLEPSSPWDADSSMENGAVIEDNVFIGFGAKVTSSVRIGSRAYICAGAVVSRDVPPRHVAHGVNKFVDYREWQGPLSRSSFFA